MVARCEAHVCVNPDPAARVNPAAVLVAAGMVGVRMDVAVTAPSRTPRLPPPQHQAAARHAADPLP